MKSMLLVLTLSLAFAGFAQQSTKAQSGDQVANKSKIFIYRDKGKIKGPFFNVSKVPLSVYSDEKEMAVIDAGHYFVAHLEPGKHTLHSNDQHSGVQMEIEPNKEYFVRINVESVFPKVHGSLELTTEEQGKREVQGLQPLKAKLVRDRERVTVTEKP